MGEMPVEMESGGISTERTATVDITTGAGLETMGFVFHAREARAALMIMTARGTMVKPDKQPLPCSSYWGAAVCR
jgi:hypothetical protein